MTQGAPMRTHSLAQFSAAWWSSDSHGESREQPIPALGLSKQSFVDILPLFTPLPYPSESYCQGELRLPIGCVSFLRCPWVNRKAEKYRRLPLWCAGKPTRQLAAMVFPVPHCQLCFLLWQRSSNLEHVINPRLFSYFNECLEVKDYVLFISFYSHCLEQCLVQNNHLTNVL